MENGMNTAVYMIERTIKELEVKLVHYTEDHKDKQKRLDVLNILIQETCLELYNLKRSIQVLKNA